MRNKNWNRESAHIEALKYNSRDNFQENSAGAYSFARKNKILNEICSHMTNGYHLWTNDEIRLEALKYNTKKEFRSGNSAAYSSSIRRGIYLR